MYTLPELDYDFNALSPHIDEETMRIHHGKHHAAYVKNLNSALEGHDELLALSIENLMASLDSVPEKVHTAVRNNGGGHANHSLFWKIMSPDGGGLPSGALADAIDKTFESFENFQIEFAQAATTQFGSGWAWLVVDNGSVAITQTANQDAPLSSGKTPILGLDVWEHAYYLNYQNMRADYVSAWWNVVNWSEVERRYAELV